MDADCYSNTTATNVWDYTELNPLWSGKVLYDESSYELHDYDNPHLPNDAKLEAVRTYLEAHPTD